LAGHLGLGKLILFYDDNQITIDGETELSFTEDVGKRYEAYGWHVQTVHDGNSYDMSELRQAVANAKAETNKPSMIKVKTTIGFGSKKQGTEKVHGSPLGDDDIKHLKTLFGFDPEAKFVVPEEVRSYYSAAASEAHKAEVAWNEMFARYSAEYSADAAEFTRTLAGQLPENWAASLPTWTAQDKDLATRQSSQQVLSKVVDGLPEVIGGSADLTPSTLTKVNGNNVDFERGHYEGRYLRYGVREHAMAALCNGIAAHGGLIPFASTFLNFVGYALGAIRLSALSHFRVLYIMTHDSIGLGEDGPTHQPVETLASLRAMPNMLVLRPADGNEVSGAYRVALEHMHTPSTIALSRQNCANLAGSSAAKVALGAYVLADADDAKVIIAATGSEVQLVVKAAAALKAEGIAVRVVSFPSWELFERQSLEYKESVLTPGLPVLSVEAASITGWQKYSHGQVGMTTFGMSAPAGQVFEALGFTVANIADKAKKLIAFYGNSAPSLTRHAF
jgi:transketolase